MSFTVEDVIRLRDGWRGPITVGELPPEVAVAMRVNVPLVYLSRVAADENLIAFHD